MQVANNYQVEDFLRIEKDARQDCSGKTLEMKYNVRTKEEILNLLSNKGTIKKQIEQAKSELKFDVILCRFFFKDYFPTIKEQKELTDFQIDIFDQISVQMLGEEFEDFKIIYEYTRNKTNKGISTVIDTKLKSILLIQVMDYIVKNQPTSSRWIYRKIESNLDRYHIINRNMPKVDIPFYLVGCTKRFGGKTEFKNLDISTLGKAIFGFNGCCLDYRPTIAQKGKKRFVPMMDSFNEKSYEWEKIKNEEYKKERTKIYLKLNSINSDNKETLKNKKIKALMKILGK
ncbi:MAG: hypothetical protein ABIJ18_04900 [archaeon]